VRRFDLGAWPRKKKQYNKKVTKVSYFPYLGGSPCWADSTLKLHDEWCPRRNHVCRVSYWNLYGVEFSIFLLIFAWTLQQCSANAQSACDNSGKPQPIRTKFCTRERWMTTFRTFWACSAQSQWNGGSDEFRTARVFFCAVYHVLYFGNFHTKYDV